MKIVINTSHQRFGGAIQVALSFIYECRNFPQNDYYVWVGEGVANTLKEDEFPSNFHFEYFNFGRITLAKTFMINKTLRKVEKRIKPDVIIATSGPSYFHSIAPQILGYNIPLYIYSESPFLQKLSLYRQMRRLGKRFFHFYFFKRDAKALVVQTDDVNKRVRKALGIKNVYTVSNTANNFYQNWKPYDWQFPKNKNVFRFITITSFYGHKNLDIIPAILDQLYKQGVKDVEFVLTLKKEDFLSHIGSHNGIINVGPVKPYLCPSLYAECDALFLPTLAECFSASYPEAMIMERPIVTTDLGFARSICGEAALFYEANNAKAAADQIVRIIKDKELQNDLIRKGKEQLKTFDSPQDRARKYLEICEKYANCV